MTKRTALITVRYLEIEARFSPVYIYIYIYIYNESSVQPKRGMQQHRNILKTGHAKIIEKVRMFNSNGARSLLWNSMLKCI